MPSMIWLTLVLCGVLAPTVHVINGEPATLGFTSIDCGVSSGHSYTSEATNITYTSDDGYIDTGDNYNIAANYYEDTTTPEQSLNLRSFGRAGARNCYTLSSEDQNKYLLRASFMYGNYDGKSSSSLLFDLHIGVNRWATVNITDTSKTYTFEAITVALRNSVSVCLINIGHGTPFISSLEMRLWKTSMYPAAAANQSLILLRRLNIGAPNDAIIRYPDDPYDRFWLPYTTSGWANLSTTEPITHYADDYLQAPPAVLQTAVTPSANATTLSYSWEADRWPAMSSATPAFFLFLHFTDFQNQQLRSFDIYYNGYLWEFENRSYVPPYLYGSYVPSVGAYTWRMGKYTISLNATRNSTLPPILNALEIYTLFLLDNNMTFLGDVDAIMSIKLEYQVKKNWMGDPCFPVEYAWDGVKCDGVGSNNSRIISLDLSNSGLNGLISSNFSLLTSLKYLDLSYNNLSGPIPDSLANLSSLHVLNLSGNSFSGSIPSALCRGSLTVRNDGNGDACNNRRTKSTIIIIVSVVVAAVVLTVLVLLVVVVASRKKKQKGVNVRRIHGPRRSTGEARLHTPTLNANIFESDSVEGTGLSSPLVEFSIVCSATNNFSDKLGEGGFGPVYKGILPNGQEIAIKRLSSSSGQGLEEFKNEVTVISKLQHRNLVRFFGFCIHGEEKMLLYEYMPNKSLDSFTFDERKRAVLGWKLRYKIVQGIARGLIYLHQDSRLRIIHRDLKASNVLLDEDFNPKISDFGMARTFCEHQSQALTHRVVGTYGYMSPEYAMEGKFSEKSDVFSFGVLLLEIVSGRRNSSFVDNEQSMNLLGYAWTLWKENSVSELIDPVLGISYSCDEVCRCIQVGLLCVQELPEDRPATPLLLRMLSGDVTLPAPKQAAFFVGRVPADDKDTGSLNELTCTDLQGR